MPINKGRPVFIVFHVQLTETNCAIYIPVMFFLTVIMRGREGGEVSHASKMDSRPLVAALIRRPVNLRFVSFRFARGKSHNGRERNRLSADRGLSTRFQLGGRGGRIIRSLDSLYN